jgi:OmpA-OmpF porin, OOP family
MECTMTKFRMTRSLLATAAVLLSVGFLSGCGVPKELTAADQAIAAARQAGKDKDCPELFAAAEKLKNDAFAVCTPCDTKKAIELANESMARAKALCPPKPVPPPPPVVKAPPAPVITFAANPASVKQGECSTLTWTTSNASGAMIDQGVGKVDLNGSKKVCPDATTTYKLGANGAGGARDASAMVTVVPRVIDRLTLHVNFATNKATFAKADDADVEKAVEFLKKYPTAKFDLEGHTDSTGPKAYNQTLSEKRAEAVKERLVKRGIDPARIHTAGFGDTKPVGDNKTVKGRAENRRVEVLILSE